MGEVIPLGMITNLNIPADRVLEQAQGQLDDGVVLMGRDNDGELYFASSIADGGEVLWLLERCKTLLMKISED